MYIETFLSVCPPDRFGWNCSGLCTCNLNNTINCNSAFGICHCKPGWRGADCDTDIPECTENMAICGNNAQCEEEPGNYRCVCHMGYTMGEKGKCEGMYKE